MNEETTIRVRRDSMYRKRFLRMLMSLFLMVGIAVGIQVKPAYAGESNTSENTAYAQGVEYYVALDGIWQRISMGTELPGMEYVGNSNRYYTTPAALEKIYGKFGFQADTYNGERIFPHSAGQDTEQIWADMQPSNASGEWHISLSKADKIYIYYLPANTEGHLSYFTSNKKLLDQTMLEENMFYSITVSDPDKLTKVPDVQYVRKGEECRVTLPTKDGYKWKVLNRLTLEEITPTETIQSDDEVTYVFKDIDQGIKIEPVNPKNDKIVIKYNAATVTENLEKLSEVAPGVQTPEEQGQIQGDDSFKVTLSKSETKYKLLRTDKKKVLVKIPGSSKDKKYWYAFRGWKLGDTGTVFQSGETLSVKELKSYEVNGVIELNAVWKGKNDNGRVGSCNFYLNKTCEIVDNTTNGFQNSPQENYTKAIYTSKVNEDNDLQVDAAGNLNLLAPKDSTNAYEVDSQIRQLTKTPYEGITMEEFPSDEEVLANLRANYNEKDPIKVGDRVIPKDELTTESFKVRWASFKYVKSDGWHVDGILVAKEGHLVIKKTFTGSAKTAIEKLKDTFNITVKHNDNPTANDLPVTDYKLVIKSKSEAGSDETGYDSYDEDTHTFTWNLIVRDYQQYDIKENDYKVPEFDNSVHTYTVRNTDSSDEDKASTQEIDWNTYDDEDGVRITATAYPDDIPSTAYQTVSFRNMYVTSNIITIDKMDNFTINGMNKVKFKISSVDEPDSFQLWRHPGSNAYCYEKDVTPQWGFTEQVADNTVETDSTGLVQLKLKPGDYIIQEQVPEGYKKASAFRIQVDEEGHVADSYLCDEDGERMDGTLDYLITSPKSSVITLKNHAEELTTVTAQAKMNDVKADSVEVELWCNGSKMSGSQYTQTLNASNDWKYTWKNLPLYADGKVANYTLRETRLGDVSYDPATNTDGYGDYIVTFDKCKYREADTGEYNDPASWTDDNGKKHYAKHALLVVNNKNEVPEERYVKVKAQVQWNDGNNQDGIRPDLVDMKLYDSDGEAIGNALELNADNEWTANYVDLDKYKDNKEVGYQITAKSFQVPDQYTAEITGDMVNGFVVVLTHTPKTETLSGIKKWSDQDNKAQVRPNQVKVNLLANGEKVDETTTTADKNWKFSFDNKPVYKDGEKIHYTVQESDVANYTPTYSTDDEGNFVITNKYAPISVKLTGDTALRMTTVVTGKASTEAFVSELTAAEDYGDAVKMPKDNTVTTADKIAKDGSEENTFSPVEITQEGTYTFRVKTITQAKKPGWIYDNDSKTLTVKVVDQNGKLVVDQASSTLNAVATHSFHAAALEGDTAITIQKKLIGRSMWGDEKFSFTLSAADDDTKKAVEDGDIELAETKASVSKMQNGATATVSFGRAEFKEEGTYTFQAKEDQGSRPGMTYDTEAKTIKVKVQGENGVLKATQENVPTFENVYRAEGSFTPEGTKTLLSANGNKLSVGENQFKFSVRILGDDTNKVVATGTTGSGKDAKINFSTMTYSIEDLEKLYKSGLIQKIPNDNWIDYEVDYVVTEEPTGKDSLQQNTQTQQFSVTYCDTTDGKLTVMNTGGKNISFENRYVTDTATVSMDGSKVLEGRDLAKDEFSFHITSDDANAPMPKETTVKNDASGNVSFGDITYTKDDLGDATSKTYTYKITESGSQPGVTNDSETKTVKVKVTDDGEGHITAETEPGATPLFTFTNIYKPTAAESSVTNTISMKKVLEGRTLKADEFHFVMKEEGGDVVARASNKADGTISFPAQKFTEAGTYNYTIEEEAGDSTHVTYDDTTYQVTAVATDNYDGKPLSVTWTAGTKDIEFHNVYTATPVSVNPNVVKEITGDTPKTTDTFHFSLSGVSVDGDADKMPPMPAGSTDGAKVVDITGAGNADFGAITFEKAGTYRYQVVELTGQNPRYTYDTTTYQLTYVVKDQDGTLTAEAAIESADGTAESLVFSNRYTRSTVKLEGDTAITVQKELTGRSMLAGEKFGFTIKPADDATKAALEKGDIKIADDTASVESLHKGETATVSFGSVEFAEEGEYTFQVQEKDGGKAGMIYDTEAKTLKVKVTSENDTLKAVQENVPAFKNSYKAEGTFTPAGTKTLLSAKGNKLNIQENQFTFEVRYLQDPEGKPVATGTTKSGKDAAIDFGTLTYSTSELQTLIQKGYADEAETDNGAEYYIEYVVTEKDTGNDAIQKNSEAQTFQVVLKDDGTGKLTATSEEGKSLQFQNRYVTDTAVVSMDGQKVLKVRPLSDGEFTFHISSDDANAPMPEKTSVKNTAAGGVSFGDITFTKDDLGDATSKTFTYKITESGSQPGVTNDSETKTVQVKVTDDGKGHIQAETDPSAAPLFAFTNSYKPVSAESSVTDAFQVKKVLEGRDIKEGEFQFVMKDAEGKEIATATNKADGTIQFPVQEFTEVGTYNYTIEEVSGDLDRVTYDETVHHVTAVVTDNYDGKPLSVTWSAGEASIEFHNVYTPKSDNPSEDPSVDPSNPDDHGNGNNGGKANGKTDGGKTTGRGTHVSGSTPSTGDDTNTGFFLSLMAISSAMLAGVTGLRKKMNGK